MVRRLPGTDVAIGRITTSGRITGFPPPYPRLDHGGPGRRPVRERGRRDWADRVERPAARSPGAEGSAEACQTAWSSWRGPSPGCIPFDGYAWLRDGTPIPGQTASTYVTTAGDVGHRLACRLTVTYPLPFSVTATATSAAITVQPAPPPPPTPALSALDITPRMFTLTGRRVGGRCQPSSRSDRGRRPCIRRVALTVRFRLSVGATVTFAIERELPGV